MQRKVERNLWIITGVTSFPFVILALANPDKVVFPHLYILIAIAGIYNGLFVPFFLMRGEGNWLRHALAIGGNLLISYFWIEFTGGVESIFYPAFYLLPIVAATLYAEFLGAMVTALLAALLSLYARGQAAGWQASMWQDTRMLAQLVLFFLVAAIVGYLLKVQREQFRRNQKMNEELEIAYSQLMASHDQLQSYTNIIEKMNREMEQLAITDELTGLYNYRYFQMTLDKELKRNRHSSLTLIMLDIDDFKTYNDRYGHMMGDKMLAEVARTIKQQVREIDTVVRYGGEEFAILLPATRSEEGFNMAENLRQAIAALRVATPDGQQTSITVSAGISCFPADSLNKSELISHADLALYRAKEDGRNLSRVYEKLQ